MGKKHRYGVILDAGSSGTRLHVYRWQDPAKAIKHASPEDLQNLPKLETKKKWTKKIRPGVSSFAEKPHEIGPDHLQELVNHALDAIPKHKVKDTPVYLMATAGMRLLPKHQQDTLMQEICSYFRQHTLFSLPDCAANIQVISGETEGLYGWIASNYLLGGFDRPQELDASDKGHHTLGFLDMGGASAQIAFAPNSTEAAKHADDLKLVRLRTLNGEPFEHRVFSATWLGFGVNQARESYVEALHEHYGDPQSHELPDPCMPMGLRTTLDGELVHNSDGKTLTLTGTGKFDECLQMTHPLLGKDAPCNDHPCLLDGQHVPAIDFDINHFVGVSEYWHTTHGVFDQKGDRAYDLATYQHRVEDFCTQDWAEIESSLEARKKDKAKDAQEACFKASWLINVLYEGIGVPRIGIEHTHPGGGSNESSGGLDPSPGDVSQAFRPVDKIDGIEVSWTLGKMLLYAAGQIPPVGGEDKLVPVGFGSNLAGDNHHVPDDFQYAGSNWSSLKQIGGVDHDGDDNDIDDWDDVVDVADGLVDKAKNPGPSFLIFLLVLAFIAYLLRKKERRVRYFGKLASLCQPSRSRPGTPRKSRAKGLSGLTHKLFGGRRSSSYDRIMEEGSAPQFELGSMVADSSDDNDVSDGSDGSGSGSGSRARSGHRSRTPKLNVESIDDEVPKRPGSAAIDRAGLVVRTESRERLAGPRLQMLNAGRRSRTGSPTRTKSPGMTPLSEDW